MVRKSYLVLVLILIPGLLLATPNSPAKRPDVSIPIPTGDEVVTAPVAFPPYNLPIMDGTDDVIGDTLTIGTSWYDIQHNGTIGRMVEKSDDGYLHFIWMNGLNSGASNRHVYYNVIDPSGTQLWPYEGYPVESSAKAGYTTMDVDYGGIAFPAFHQTMITGGDYWTAVACDFFPHSGAFLVYEAPPVSGLIEVIWPRIQFSSNQSIHVLSTENPASGVAGDPQRHYYIKGEYDPVGFSISYDPEWELMTWTMTIAGDLATSEVSDRVAFAWTYCRDEGFPTTGDFSQRNNDIYVLIDDDGQDFNFTDAFNLTQFIEPDLSFLPDTVLADMDTLRAYTDLNIFIDQDDWVHVVFTTPSYFELEGTTYWHPSIIWHWSEQFPGEFHIVHNAFDDWDWNYTDCGAWNVKAQRPSIAQDPSTGNLYCMYQVYDCDTTALSSAGWPSGEIYLSMSEDGGENWSVGLNVTNTVTPRNAPPGECLSEITPSMAKLVDGTCHIEYVLDRDAGTVVQNEGTWTLNEVKYHSVDVDLLSPTPYVPQDVPFHVEHSPYQPGIPGAKRLETPKNFALGQNYPNPFNPMTTITFSLDQVSEVSLKVYNLMGKEIATLAAGTYGTGQHTVIFDGSNLASGLYIYKLEAAGRTLERKMLLLK